MSSTKQGEDPIANLGVRRATIEDLDGLTETLTAAFANDPVWSWAFPDQRGLGVDGEAVQDLHSSGINSSNSWRVKSLSGIASFNWR